MPWEGWQYSWFFCWRRKLQSARSKLLSILTNLFGAWVTPTHWSLSTDYWDQRHGGGGLGVWLGIFTGCWISSVPLGFGIGGAIAEYRPPTWSLYLRILILLVTLILGLFCQPGLLVLSVYTGWVCATVVLTTPFLALLLGVYNTESVHIVYTVFLVLDGALASILFKRGNAFLRSRYRLDGSRGAEGGLLV